MLLPLVSCLLSVAFNVSLVVGLIVLTIACMMPVLFQLYLHRPDWLVQFGNDGLSIQRSTGEEFIPWTRFEGFIETNRGIHAKTPDGDVPIGGIPRSPEESLGALSRAAELAQKRPPKLPHVLTLIEGHDESRWPELLERAAAGDFRTNSITEMHLRDDLLNPDTPPALREVLASTLKVRVDVGETIDAIATLASERSKKALRSLLADAD
ncbi:MAG: hypothetical protein AB8H86_27740 [Polyangiales bacterium]